MIGMENRETNTVLIDQYPVVNDQLVSYSASQDNAYCYDYNKNTR